MEGADEFALAGRTGASGFLAAGAGFALRVVVAFIGCFIRLIDERHIACWRREIEPYSIRVGCPAFYVSI
jgi:hypothetical protein